MENLGKEFEKSTEFTTPRSINQIGGAAPPAPNVAVIASEKESYLEIMRASNLADQIELAELEGLELKEKIRAKKAEIAALQSEKDASIARTMANEAIRAEYQAQSAEQASGDMSAKKRAESYPPKRSEASIDAKDSDVVSDLDSSGYTAAPPAKENQGILKQMMEDLYKHPLEDTDIGSTLDFGRKIIKFARFGGVENPVNFLGDALYEAVEEFVAKKYCDGIAFEERYKGLQKKKALAFFQDVTESAVEDQDLDEDRLLSYSGMAFSNVFDPKNVQKYISSVKLDLTALPKISELSAIKQILAGLQPAAFRQLIVAKNPHLQSAGTLEGEKGLYSLIRDARSKEQRATNLFTDGYGKTSKIGGSGGGRSGGGGGRSGATGGDGDARYGYVPKCDNCGGMHSTGQCTTLCTRCKIPCGKCPRRAPCLSRTGKRSKLYTGSRRENFSRRSTRHIMRAAFRR
jgi:hypothetical protein